MMNEQSGFMSTPGGGEQGVSADAGDILRAKLHLVAARERGDVSALEQVLKAFPMLTAQLVEFDAGLLATSSYADLSDESAVAHVGQRARQRAFAAVFAEPAASLSVAPAASLRVLREAKRLSQVAVARQLGLGVDVINALEHGRIRVASITTRLATALGELLDLSAAAVENILQAQVATVPALRRARHEAGENAAEGADLDFAEAIRLSPNMSAEEKQRWLEGDNA